MSSAPGQLLLIDGSSYIYRAFFALPPLTAPDGRPTNAVFGFTTMLLKLLRDVKPSHLGVVFDAPGETFRDELFREYKANRPRAPDDLVSQIPMVHEVVRALRVQLLSIAGVEADDVIATLADRVAASGVRCTVITGDKDLMQVVGPSVQLWDTMKDRRVDEAAVRERFGVDPEQVVEVLGLMGDSTDNIPGVKGIGEKTATALIQRFGGIENLLAHVDEVESSGLRNARRIAQMLRDGASAARLSRSLALVRRDVPIALGPEDFRYDGPDAVALRELFARLGFQSLARELTITAQPVTTGYRVLEGPEDVAALHESARRHGRVALAAVNGDDLAPSKRAKTVVLAVDGEEPVGVHLGEQMLRAAVGNLLADPSIEIVGHDLKRDLLLLGPDLTVGGPAYDVMVASYLLDPSASHRLEDLAREILGRELPEFRTGIAGTAAGASVVCGLAVELTSRLRGLEMTSLFRDLEMPLMLVLTAMERRGIRLDVNMLAQMSVELEQQLQSLTTEIHRLANRQFNINSAQQLREVLFEHLGLSKKGVRRGKTGYSTDSDVLTRLAREHPVPALILQYRALAKLKSTYVDALPPAVSAVTSRLHTSFNQTVAVTGRLSSSNPNLQNIPARSEDGQRIRAAFVADPGCVLVAADYSQIELRVLAHLSQDPGLIEAFRADVDVHRQTAAELFNVLPGMVTPDMRRAAKVINFGIVYGMGPQRLAHELSISVSEAQSYIEGYFRRYAEVRRFLDETISNARRDGCVRTLCGRRRALPGLASRQRAEVQAAERTATNTPIQGTAADIIKLAMVALERRFNGDGPQAAMILQVHDELVFEVAEGDVEQACLIIRTEMEQALPLAVPLKVDLAGGRNWAEAHR